jgi:DNA-binding FadR family transcriptional regulator
MPGRDDLRAGTTTISAPKLASIVARLIEDDVVARGWPEGTVLGSETELVETYGVSRAVLREAVRLVEHAGAARMRRGPGGGLVVTAPDRRAVVTAMGVWCSYNGVTMAHLAEVRRPLLLDAVAAAARQARPGDATRLRTMVQASLERGGPTARDVVAVEGAIVAVADNPALSMFVDVLTEVALDRSRRGRARIEPPFTPTGARAHLQRFTRLADALAGHDAPAAVALAGEIVDEVTVRFHDVVGPRPPTQAITPRPGKLAEQVARAVRDDIEAAGWPVGANLGSETDVLERYGVSRAILREAVRILEHHGMVRTKRGPHGGIIVTAPDGDATVRAARLVLEHEHVTGVHLLAVRKVLDLETVRWAAARTTQANAAALLDAVGPILDGVDLLDADVRWYVEVMETIARSSGNPIFAMFQRAIGELLPHHLGMASAGAHRRRAAAEDARHALRRLAAEVAAGDVERATKRVGTMASAARENVATRPRWR